MAGENIGGNVFVDAEAGGAPGSELVEVGAGVALLDALDE